jgi:hypothetical protein
MCTDWNVKYERKMTLGRSWCRYGDNINHDHEELWFEAFDGWYMKVEELKFKRENRDFIDYVSGSDIIWIVESLPERGGDFVINGFINHLKERKKEREHGDTVESQKSGNVHKVMKVFD